MSPSRGTTTPDVREAQLALRRILAGQHVLDALPERSRQLAVDAELSVFSVLATVVSEQHPRAQLVAQLGPLGRRGSTAAGRDQDHKAQPLDAVMDGMGDGMQLRREGLSSPDYRGGHRLSGVDSGATQMQLPRLNCGVVPPSLPSNILAEVCEFYPPATTKEDSHRDTSGTTSRHCSGDLLEKDREGSKEESKELRTISRRWTGLDDGWGTQQTTQDLEKMPMGMPVTIGEVAEFLLAACSGEGVSDSTNSTTEEEQKRWASSRLAVGTTSNGVANDEKENDKGQKLDLLDASLAQWRTLRQARHDVNDKVQAPKEKVEANKDGGDMHNSIIVEEDPHAVVGPVLVHKVSAAPPRPIFCTEDPDASMLKAVQLMLGYPELNALPIVSSSRCAVVAHITLSSCLHDLLRRLKGKDVMPLAELPVRAADGSTEYRHFSAADFAKGESFDSKAKQEMWATRLDRPAPSQEVQAPWVLAQSRPLKELLMFFALSHYSGIPIVEDDADSGLVGYLSRRDLLQYLDLTMQSAARRAAAAENSEEELPSQEGTEAQVDEDKNVFFDVNQSVVSVFETLRRYRGSYPLAIPLNDRVGVTEDGYGATLVYAKELPLKDVLIVLLRSENRKLLFVEECSASSGSKAPKLLRLLSVSDVWSLLIGVDDPSQQAAKACLSQTTSDPLPSNGI